MLIRRLPSTLFQIVGKIIFSFKFIVKSTDDPDNNFPINSEALMG